MVATRAASRNGTPAPISPPAPTSQRLNDAPQTPGSPTTIEMTTNLSNSKTTSMATPAGEVTVRPFRSSSNAQLKAVLSFTPRTSALDRQNVDSQGDTFRGFFTLFWIVFFTYLSGLALLFMRTSLESWETNKTPLSWTFGRLITRDAFVLACADALMVLSMFLCVPFVKGLQYGWFSYHWTGMIIQHLFQAAYLGVAIACGIIRDWYWVQSGYLVLHALSSMMKMHSYMSHNGMLSAVAARLKRERAELERYLDTLPGGKEAAVAEANKRRSELEAKEAQTQDYTPGGTPLGTPSLSAAISLESLGAHGTMTPNTGSGLTGYNVPAAAARKLQTETGSSSRSRSDSSGASSPPPGPRGSTSALSPRPTTSTGRRRRSKSKHLATDALPAPEPDLPHGTSLEPSANTTPHEPRAPHLLGWSADEKVALLARNIDAMEDELKSNGVKGLVWPQNVTYAHFADFMIVPALVYQLEYPRTAKMNPFVVLEKIIATFGTFSLIYLITEHYILPFLPKPEDSMFKSFLNLALPMIVNYLLIFYIIFECVCQGFAELSYFADREFYQDWWNSTSWDQFSRRWNKPVHTFLLRHVYASSMDGLQLSRMSAAFVTFLLSALCHELVMAVVSKKVRPYLFLMQMAQVPMIALGRLPIVRRNKTIGNIVFWMGLMAGFPLLAIGYLKY